MCRAHTVDKCAHQDAALGGELLATAYGDCAAGQNVRDLEAGAFAALGCSHQSHEFISHGISQLTATSPETS